MHGGRYRGGTGACHPACRIGACDEAPASAAAVGTPAPFGFTELLYAATSAGGNNGSGLSRSENSNTPLINVVLGVEMLFARLAPLAAALVLAGDLTRKGSGDRAVGLSTSGALFAVLLLVIIVLIGALSLLPAFALGPLAGSSPCVLG